MLFKNTWILRHFVIGFFIFNPALNIYSQDLHFSQFFEAPLLRNPALAGLYNGDLRFQALYRNQWNSVTNAYQTASLNGEYKLPVGKSNDFLTLGGEIFYDRSGSIALTSTHVLPVLNYHKSLNNERNMYLSLGFMGGLVQRKLDRSKITTNSQFNGLFYDPSLATGETFINNGFSYFDASTGLSFNTQIGPDEDNNIFVGLAYHHFNRSSKITFYGNTAIEMIPKWVASAGVRMSLTDYSFITFHGDYTKQGTSREIIWGMLYSYKLDDPSDPKYIFHAGTFVRWKDAVIPFVKLEFSPMAISLSYDVNISELKVASTGRGGLELSLSYQGFCDRTNSTKDAVRCPRF